MERKIGEIFKYLDEWYQCIEEKTCTCFGCDFSRHNCDDINLQKAKGSCQSEHRSDKKSVVFKKLEKIGEPFVYEKRTCQTYQLYNPTILRMQQDEVRAISVDRGNYTADIEIKQNKKDMEGNKSMKEKLKEYLETATEEQLKNDFEVLKRFNESGIPVQEFIESQMSHHLKKIDLEAAKAGKPICTRDGRKARIICFDAKGDKPIIALIEMGVAETPNNYPIDGKAISTKETPCELMMLSEKKEGWINVYALNTCYSSKEEAEANIDRDYEDEYVRTVKINWEE